MASNAQQKPGLTTFGWLALIGGAAAYLSNSDRRQKLVDGVKGFTGKLGGSDADTAPGADK